MSLAVCLNHCKNQNNSVVIRNTKKIIYSFHWFDKLYSLLHMLAGRKFGFTISIVFISILNVSGDDEMLLANGLKQSHQQ